MKSLLLSRDHIGPRPSFHFISMGEMFNSWKPALTMTERRISFPVLCLNYSATSSSQTRLNLLTCKLPLLIHCKLCPWSARGMACAHVFYANRQGSQWLGLFTRGVSIHWAHVASLKLLVRVVVSVEHICCMALLFIQSMLVVWLYSSLVPRVHAWRIAHMHFPYETWYLLYLMGNE